MEKKHKNFEKQLEELVEEMSQLIIEKLNSLEDKKIFIRREKRDYPKLRNYKNEEMEIKSILLDEDGNLVLNAQHYVYGEKDNFGIDEISIEQLAFLTEIIIDPNYDNE